uniref:Uncharacterized protein n=1 Tax=Arundo donax TaxID=35708 RepID=A0A0A9T7X6_ARUDO
MLLILTSDVNLQPMGIHDYTGLEILDGHYKRIRSEKYFLTMDTNKARCIPLTK